jgi:hypothetical protein
MRAQSRKEIPDKAGKIRGFGYKKPPKERQRRKGQSGNPKNLTEKWRGERRKEDDEEDSIFHLDSYLACRLCPDRKIIEA